jgi:hypothetical protein
MMMSRRALRRGLASAAILMTWAAVVNAQDAVVVPGPEYRAGPLRAWLLGDDYRDLWLQPVSAPVLDLGAHAGGLTPLRRGGGRQTAALRLLGGDGREYSFRSVSKVPELARHPDLRGALVGRLIQDQASSMVPAAPVVAGALSAAAEVLAPLPRLFVMPDDPALGEFRDEFAGMLGTLEEVADEHENGMPGIGGFARIVATGTMLEHLEEDPGHSVDTAAYLRARLLDLLIGDWDRHEDQWRWGRSENGASVRWVPIARDRDYAFSDYDGALLGVVRRAVPNAVRFRRDYGGLDGLLMNSIRLDRELLAWVDRPAYDSAAVELQRRLPDEVLDRAIATLPPELTALRGAELGEILRARRDALPAVASAYYEDLSGLVEIRLSDLPEVVEVSRGSDGSVEVVSRAGVPGAATRRRRFEPGVTREVRIHLRGGADHAVVRGAAERGVLVRLIGGGGQDVLIDESAVAQRGRWTTLHDHGAGDRLQGTAGTVIDRREGSTSEREPRGLLRTIPPDHGSAISWSPLVDYSTTRGATVGVAVSRTTYAFRREPFARRWHTAIRYAPRWSSLGLDVGLQAHTADPAVSIAAGALFSDIEASRFYGFGNEPAGVLDASPVVRHRVMEAAATVRLGLSESLLLSVGPSVRRSRASAGPETPLALTRPPGWTGWSGLGGRTGLELDATLPTAVPLELSGQAIVSGYQRLDAESGIFGGMDAELLLTLPLSRAWASGGAGWQHAWGSYPFDQAAYLGGRESLRGYPEWRFAGDAALHGTAEVGHELGRMPLLMNWRAAIFGFVDAGRVFHDGERSSRWHAAPGVGLRLRAMELAFHVTYAHGPSGRIYLETLTGGGR